VKAPLQGAEGFERFQGAANFSFLKIMSREMMANKENFVNCLSTIISQFCFDPTTQVRHPPQGQEVEHLDDGQSRNASKESHHPTRLSQEVRESHLSISSKRNNVNILELEVKGCVVIRKKIAD
jgi:hypothetical protein